MPTVLIGTGIIYNSHDPAHAGVVTERVPRPTQAARIKVRVVMDTGVLFDEADPNHVKAGSEWITRNAQALRADQVCVVYKTGILFNQANSEHVKAGFEWIARNTQRKRADRVCVVCKTGTLFDQDNPEHVKAGFEWIARDTQRKRVDQVCVVYKTGTLFDQGNPAHVKAGSQWVARNVQQRRADQVCVVKKTGVLFDQANPEHMKAGEEWIAQQIQKSRANKVWVVYRTGIPFDATNPEHVEAGSQLITRNAQRARKKRAAKKLRDKVAASATQGGVSTSVGAIANTAAVSSRHAVGVFATRGADALPGSKRSRPPNVGNTSVARPSQRSRLLAADELASVSGPPDKASDGAAATRSTTADNSQPSQGPVAVEAGATTSTSVSATVDAGNPVPACEPPALGGDSGLCHSPAFFGHPLESTVAPVAGCGSSVFEFDFINELDGDKTGSPCDADLFGAISP